MTLINTTDYISKVLRDWNSDISSRFAEQDIVEIVTSSPLTVKKVGNDNSSAFSAVNFSGQILSPGDIALISIKGQLRIIIGREP